MNAEDIFLMNEISGVDDDVKNMHVAPENDGSLLQLKTMADALEKVGFSASSSKGYEKTLSGKEVKYDPFTPTVSMVARRNGKVEPPVSNAIVFLHAGSDSETVTMHLAIDGSVPDQEIEQLMENLPDAYFNRDPVSGAHVGYVNIKAEITNDNEVSFEKAFEQIKEKGLKTTPLPFTERGLSFLPFATNELGENFAKTINQEGPDGPGRTNMAQMVGEHLPEALELVDFPEQEYQIALEMLPDVQMSNAENNDFSRHAPSRMVGR